MFRDLISTTPFTTDPAELSLGHIQSSTFGTDKSMIATLRALLGKRIPNDKTFSAYLERCFGFFDHASEAADEAGTWFLRRNADLTFLGVGSLRNEDEWDSLPELIVNKYPGWSHVKKITLYFRDLGRVFLFLNKEKRRSIVVADRINKIVWHVLQTAIPVMLPWYFSGDTEIGTNNEDEKLLLRALKEDESPDNYLNILRRMADAYDFRGVAIRKALSGFETASQRQRERQLKEEIDYYASQMRELLERYREKLRRRNDMLDTLTGLQLAIEKTGEQSKLMDYFLSCRNLDVVSCEDGNLRFIVRGSAAYWSEDAAEINIDNFDSAFYMRTHDTSVEDAQLLYRAIFLDKTVTLRMCAAYVINPYNGMEPISGYYFSDEYDSYMPNPHIQHYTCAGDYPAAALECVTQGNYIGAVEECIASCCNLNVNDSIVMRQFCKDLFYEKYKCLEMEDGSIMTADEAIEYLKSKTAE